jgi:hypothetical protein
MSGRPRSTEAAAYYFTYIDQVKGEGAVGIIERQLGPPLVTEPKRTLSPRRTFARLNRPRPTYK